MFLFLPINFPSSQHRYTQPDRDKCDGPAQAHQRQVIPGPLGASAMWIYSVFVGSFFLLLHNSEWLLYFYRFHMNAFRLMIANTYSLHIRIIHIKMARCGNTTRAHTHKQVGQSGRGSDNQQRRLTTEMHDGIVLVRRKPLRLQTMCSQHSPWTGRADSNAISLTFATRSRNSLSSEGGWPTTVRLIEFEMCTRHGCVRKVFCANFLRLKWIIYGRKHIFVCFQWPWQRWRRSGTTEDDNERDACLDSNRKKIENRNSLRSSRDDGV